MPCLVCSICLDPPTSPYILPKCEHYFCRKCLEELESKVEDLCCPTCREKFSINDIKPYVPKSEPRYCMDLTCAPDSGCEKLHINDLCPGLPKYDLEDARNIPEDEPCDNYKADIFVIPDDATYCADISCPGGKKATCGKKHESDLGLTALPSQIR